MSLTDGLLNLLEDPATDGRLLPSYLERRDNGRRLRHCRIALKSAMEICLTPDQRQLLDYHYALGMSKSEIARLQGKSCSAVSKSIRAGEAAIRRYVEQYMGIYDRLERELLKDY